MKRSSTGLAIELTKQEEDLLAQIPSYDELASSHLEYEDWQKAADSMEELFLLLVERKAIPDLRMKIFADAYYAEKGNKSIKEVFESNGTKGREIIRHGNFTEYIDYFINGPILPKSLIEEFCELADDYFARSEELRHLVRRSIKSAGLTHYNVPSQIFRLAIERKVSPSIANALRSEAMTAIRKK